MILEPLQPFICFDNFYDDPDAVREYALSLDYENDVGNYPGVRTKPLNEIGDYFFNTSCRKFLSLFVDLKENVKWYISTRFQKIYRYSEDKSSPLNTGWVHTDDSFLSAVVYLNLNPNSESGTSLYSPRKDAIMKIREMDKTATLRCDFNQNKLDDTSSYEREILENNSHFEKTVEIKNVYNRIIIYDAAQFHAQSNYWMDDEDFRLTQVFFLHHLRAKNVPSQRCKSIRL